MSIDYSAWAGIGYPFHRATFLDAFRILPGQDKYAFGGETFEDPVDADDLDECAWERLLVAITEKIGANWYSFGCSDLRFIIIGPSTEPIEISDSGTDVMRLYVGNDLDWMKVLALAPEVERIGTELGILGLTVPKPVVACCWSAS